MSSSGRSTSRCRGCHLRKGRTFCNFDLHSRDSFETLGAPVLLQNGDFLFRRGERFTGIFIICTGQIRLHEQLEGAATSRLLQPGDVLGLEQIFSLRPYPSSAVAEGRARVRFVRADELRKLLERDFDACLWAMHFI